MTAVKHPLDPYLPLLEPDASTIVVEASVLEVQDMTLLLELCRNPKICRYLLARLSDTVALIDPNSAEELVQALRSAGHTPRTAKGIDP